ncbi:MAG: potassium channel protein [Spirochaetales bacterium]|nr:potassium channel protein [Spirochaetales bacterium]
MHRFIRTLLPPVFLLILLLTAVFGFSYFENIDLFEAIWMTITTVLTIGYGDLIPVTEGGRIFAMVLVPLCIVLFTYFMGQIISLMVEMNISTQKRSRRMEKKIKRLSRHIIICGLDTMTLIVIDKMLQEKKDFVLIEPDETIAEPFIDKYSIVIGDPCEDDVLLRAGIEKAEGLITARTDAENVLIIITARELNPGILITSSAEKVQSESKLRKAGADRVINPERIGGTRMALSVLKPTAVDYMDKVFASDSENFRIEEIFLSAGSKLVGKSIKEAEVRSRFDISVMAIKRNSRIFTSKLADMQLSANDMMIVFGKDENLQKFRELTFSDQV